MQGLDDSQTEAESEAVKSLLSGGERVSKGRKRGESLLSWFF